MPPRVGPNVVPRYVPVIGVARESCDPGAGEGFRETGEYIRAANWSVSQIATSGDRMMIATRHHPHGLWWVEAYDCADSGGDNPPPPPPDEPPTTDDPPPGDPSTDCSAWLEYCAENPAAPECLDPDNPCNQDPCAECPDCPGCGGTSGGGGPTIPALTQTVTSDPLTVRDVDLAAEAGSTVYATISVSGGTRPYRYKLSAGSLPSGWEIDDAGNVGGVMPSVDVAIRIRAIDAKGRQAFGWVVVRLIDRPSLPQLGALDVDSVLSDAVIGDAYEACATISGGVAPYSASVTTGSLPSGLSVSVDGDEFCVSGTPAAASDGDYTFSVTITDAVGNEIQTGSLSLTVVEALSVSYSLSSPTVGDLVIDVPTVTGGSGSLHYSVSDGSLPSGIVLDPQTGVLMGVAPASGSSFKITVEDQLAVSYETPTLTYSVAPVP